VRPRTLLALASAFLTSSLSGCLVAPHDSFATPQDTVLTFQSAFARDDQFKEYDCFAREMKEEHGLTQQVWSAGRSTAFEPLGWLGRFVLRRNSLDDNLVGGTLERDHAKLVYSLFGHGMEVELVAEAVLVLPDPIEAHDDVWTLGRERAFVDDHGSLAAAPPTFVAIVDLPRAVAEAYLAKGIPWAELRSQWKLRSVAGLAEKQEAPPLELAPTPPPPHELEIPAIRVTKAGGSLGTIRLRLVLPLPSDGAEKLGGWNSLRWNVTPAAPP